MRASVGLLCCHPRCWRVKPRCVPILEEFCAPLPKCERELAPCGRLTRAAWGGWLGACGAMRARFRGGKCGFGVAGLCTLCRKMRGGGGDGDWAGALAVAVEVTPRRCDRDAGDTERRLREL